MEPRQTWSCVSLSVASTFIGQVDWYLIQDTSTAFYRRGEAGLSVNLCLSVQPPVFSRLARAAGSFSDLSKFTSREELNWGWERTQREEEIGWRNVNRTEREKREPEIVRGAERRRNEESEGPLTDRRTELCILYRGTLSLMKCADESEAEKQENLHIHNCLVVFISVHRSSLKIHFENQRNFQLMQDIRGEAQDLSCWSPEAAYQTWHGSLQSHCFHIRTPRHM